MATDFADSDSCHPQAERLNIGRLVTNLTINFLRLSKRKTVALPQIDELKCMGKYQIIHRRQKVLRFNSLAHLASAVRSTSFSSSHIPHDGGGEESVPPCEGLGSAIAKDIHPSMDHESSP